MSRSHETPTVSGSSGAIEIDASPAGMSPTGSVRHLISTACGELNASTTRTGRRPPTLASESSSIVTTGSASTEPTRTAAISIVCPSAERRDVSARCERRRIPENSSSSDVPASLPTASSRSRK